MRKGIALVLLLALMGVTAAALAQLRFEDPLPGGSSQIPGGGTTTDSLIAAASDTSATIRVFGATSMIIHVEADTNTQTDGAAVIGLTTDSLVAFTLQYSWDQVVWAGDLGTGAADSVCNCQLLGTFANQDLNSEALGITGSLVRLNTNLPFSVPYLRSIATNIDRPLYAGTATAAIKARLDNLTQSFNVIYP